jgi:hypothetical protein
LLADYPTVQLIRNPQNLGFATANNQAIPRCRGRYVLLLNNDAFVARGALAALVDFMDRHPEVGAAGPQLRNADGSVQPSCMHFPTLRRTLLNFVRVRMGGQGKYVPASHAESVAVDAVVGACLIMRPATLDQVGLLDPGYFMYAEETDWCYRAARLGWRIAYVPGASVIHLGGQTAKRESARFYVERRRSNVRFFLKHRGRLAARVNAELMRWNIGLRWLLSPRQRKTYGQIWTSYNESIAALFAERAPESLAREP